MSNQQHTYIAIDLKSFYASVECVDRGFDPLNVNLVVADSSRTDTTICLAVSPSLKSYGIPGRPRLFEVKQKVKEINQNRERGLPNGFHSKSIYENELNNDRALAVDYVIATPRMATYMEISRKIYGIYLRFIAPEDIHVYSIDEVFMDATHYLNLYQMSPHQLSETIILEVLKETGITATAGIGTNLYLAKVAMDIVAKHTTADKNGVRIAELNEQSYRRLLWAHEPLTDFWRVGQGIARKLNSAGIYTMGDIARQALKNEGVFYDMFGVNAEYLIDHAFGEESTTIADIKAYVPQNHSIGSGQVLPEPYTNEKGKIIVREMANVLANDLVSKHLLSDSFSLYIGYDIVNVKDPALRNTYTGTIKKDWYGREVPKADNGTVRLKQPTSSAKVIANALVELYEKITDHSLFVRRVNIAAVGLIEEKDYKPQTFEQLDLFTDLETKQKNEAEEQEDLSKERAIQETMLKIQNRFGKNAILKGTNLQDGAMTRERNKQIGGHKA